MAAPEVAVSLAIARLHDLLHWYKDVIVYPNLTDQISDSISNLQWILNTRMNAELSDDYRQRLQILADKAKEMEECLVEWFGDQTPKLQKGCFAKVFASVRLFSVTNRARHWEGMAKDFMTRVKSLSSELAPFSEGNRERTRQRMESDIVGRGEHVKVLVDRLIDGESNLRVISVVGKQHCGKTAVVLILVISHVTCLGAESYWKQSLLVDILKQTAVRDPPKDLEHKDEEQLCEMLHKSLMEQRYLIVLDNWGDAELFNELLIPFVDSMNGSRVIVTTRNAEMHNDADPWTPDLHFLPDLTNKECEDLLHVSITGGGNSIDDDSQLKMTIKEEILSKCNGSPPAISLLGGLLSTVKVSKQAALIKQLKDRPTLEDIMRLSFDELPSIMKLCVLYMALYPEESEVPTRRLFRQWAAEWLLAEAANGKQKNSDFLG
ncbi:putative disease resistance protein At1g50180 [Eucalyptus grandis]|uniref:putative disease resistance protein At1g50180 n=1 Tax=Eucalyptus grandis TaxID=71139 RepID=UPI00192EDD9F|nr:putative disease resistance protein At1g50180 [Eucalyptus grandis]